MVLKSLQNLERCGFDDKQMQAFLNNDVLPDLWTYLTHEHLISLGVAQLGRRVKFMRLFGRDSIKPNTSATIYPPTPSTLTTPTPPVGPPPPPPSEESPPFAALIPHTSPANESIGLFRSSAYSNDPEEADEVSATASPKTVAAASSPATATKPAAAAAAPPEKQLYADVAAHEQPPLAPVARVIKAPANEYERLGVADMFDAKLDPLVGIFTRAGGVTALPLRVVDAQFTKETGRVFGADVADKPYTTYDLCSDPRFHVDQRHLVYFVKHLREEDARYERTVRYYIGRLINAGVTGYQIKYIYHLLGLSDGEFHSDGERKRQQHKKKNTLIANAPANAAEIRLRKSAIATLITMNVGGCVDARRAVARTLALIK